jgi:hypothetical protein
MRIGFVGDYTEVPVPFQHWNQLLLIIIFFLLFVISFLLWKGRFCSIDREIEQRYNYHQLAGEKE